MADNPFWLDGPPARSVKPRTRRLNLVRDNGVPAPVLRDSLQAYGTMLDHLKLRQFVSWYLPLEQLKEKVSLCAAHDVQMFLGGTVLEAAHAMGQQDRILEAMADVGPTSVELSNALVDISTDGLYRLAARSRDLGLQVLFEYGSKSPKAGLDVARASEQVSKLLDACADHVIIERAELDAAMGPDGTAASADELVALAQSVGLDRLVFEAETVEHQAWFIREFGGDVVDLGPNIDLLHVPTAIEPMRSGIGRWIEWSFIDVVRSAHRPNQEVD